RIREGRGQSVLHHASGRARARWQVHRLRKGSEGHRRREQNSERRRAQTSVSEGRVGKILTSPFRSGNCSTNESGYSPSSGCPNLCLMVAAVATDLAEK